MDSAEYTLEVDEDGVAVLRSPWDPALKRAIRAIPGRLWDEELGAWTIRLTPDRAESVARLLRSFPVFEAAPGAMETIETVRDRRNLRKPMIEGVTPDEEWCLSFCDDWVHPVLDEVRRFFRPRPHPEIGRLTVVVNDETRNPLLTLIERNDVGLHIRARQRLQPAPTPGATRRAARPPPPPPRCPPCRSAARGAAGYRRRSPRAAPTSCSRRAGASRHKS